MRNVQYFKVGAVLFVAFCALVFAEAAFVVHVAGKPITPSEWIEFLVTVAFRFALLSFPLLLAVNTLSCVIAGRILPVHKYHLATVLTLLVAFIVGFAINSLGEPSRQELREHLEIAVAFPLAILIPTLICNYLVSRILRLG